MMGSAALQFFDARVEGWVKGEGFLSLAVRLFFFGIFGVTLALVGMVVFVHCEGLFRQVR